MIGTGERYQRGIGDWQRAVTTNWGQGDQRCKLCGAQSRNLRGNDDETAGTVPCRRCRSGRSRRWAGTAATRASARACGSWRRGPQGTTSGTPCSTSSKPPVHPPLAIFAISCQGPAFVIYMPCEVGCPHVQHAQHGDQLHTS